MVAKCFRLVLCDRKVKINYQVAHGQVLTVVYEDRKKALRKQLVNKLQFESMRKNVDIQTYVIYV